MRGQSPLQELRKSGKRGARGQCRDDSPRAATSTRALAVRKRHEAADDQQPWQAHVYCGVRWVMVDGALVRQRIPRRNTCR
jgi:hypothetical protein